MGTTTLLDTNIAIYLTKGGLPLEVRNNLSALTQQGFNISVVTKIELLGYRFSNELEKIGTIAFIESSHIFTLNEEVVDKTIDIRSKYKIKLPDAIIAATAIVHELTLVTRNLSDFNGIDGLIVVNPFD